MLPLKDISSATPRKRRAADAEVPEGTPHLKVRCFDPIMDIDVGGAGGKPLSFEAMLGECINTLRSNSGNAMLLNHQSYIDTVFQGVDATT